MTTTPSLADQIALALHHQRQARRLAAVQSSSPRARAIQQRRAEVAAATVQTLQRLESGARP